jgi:hypothetical protein
MNTNCYVLIHTVHKLLNSKKISIESWFQLEHILLRSWAKRGLVTTGNTRQTIALKNLAVLAEDAKYWFVEITQLRCAPN